MKKICFILSFLLLSPETFGRPEYALQIMTNRCTTCHSNPVGGGHRNLVGKAFGPTSASLEAFSQQDIFAFDYRTIFYSPVRKEDRDKGKSGMGVMAALPSISVPFSKKGSTEWRLVYAHNVGGFYGMSPRDAYLRVQFYQDYRLYPQYMLIGRFTAPFGLLDDEHRTYVRQQTRTSWNDKEMGVLFSGDWSHLLHYDLAFVNGEQTAGQGFALGQYARWGGIANVRFLFPRMGWMLGASASYYNNDENSSAVSLYQNLSVGHMTKQLLPGNLEAEAVLARKMNSRVSSQFFSESAYRQAVQEGDSLGYKVQWNYNFRPDWKFIVKYDYLLFDLEYANDSYHRYAFGLRHFLTNQVSAQLRYEKAMANPESEKQAVQRGLATQDVVWLLLQVKI